jgi:hypothetical protein
MDAVPHSTPDDAGEVAPAADSAALEWTYNPWRDASGPAWRRPWVAMLLILLVAAVAGYSFSAPDWWPQALGWGGVALLMLVGSTASLFLPVRYRLDPRGVTVWFLAAPSFRPWEHYRNYYVHDTGVHLTTMPTPSGLDPFRGHLLLYAGNKASVVEYIKGHIARTRAPNP